MVFGFCGLSFAKIFETIRGLAWLDARVHFVDSMLALWLSVLIFVRFIYVKHAYYRLHIVNWYDMAYACVCYYNIDTELSRTHAHARGTSI